MVTRDDSSIAPLSELRSSAVPVFAAFLGIALVAFLAGDAQPGLPQRARLFGVTLLLLAAAGGLWSLENWRPNLARWCTVVVPAGLLYLGADWFALPELLILLVLPTGLAVALIDLRAAGILAIAETVLLLMTARTDITGLATAGIWAMLGIMAMVYQPMHSIANWAWEHYGMGKQWLLEARESQAELKQALNDIEHVNRQLALAGDRTAALRLIAEEAEKNKAEFVAQVSHEFRTPLNMIIGLVGIMVDRPEVYAEELPPDLERDLSIVHRNCEHLASMINDVLDLSRAEAGRLVLHRDWVSLAEVVDSAVAVVHPLIQKKQVQLRVSVPGQLPRLYCDRTRIRQVILNLLSNAARFTEEGSITVRAARRDSSVVVSIEDTGPGIPPEESAVIFEPFSQSPSGRSTDVGGSGLGLAISRRFVALHGGRMWLESTLGSGSSFSFELPLSEPSPHAVRPGHQIREDWVWRERSFRTEKAVRIDELTRPRVVVCDPTGGLAAHMPRYSDEAEFVHASDLQHSLEELRNCPAHALLINARSEQLVSLVGEASREMPGTPVIGCYVPRPEERILATGALGYLVKPVSRQDLKRAISAVCKPVRRVLVVDDNEHVLHLLTRMLLICDGTLEVAVASTADQALAELRSALPDLVLLDIVMPDMDGRELFELMRREVGTQPLPVYFVSARDPSDRPATSEILAVTQAGGISISKVLQCSLNFSTVLLKPDQPPDPVPVESPGT
jgi:signal transduction histidine kinase/CheY-like chemotaxis protein